MSLLDGIKFTEARKRPRTNGSADPVGKRRKKFVGFLEEQKSLAEGNAPKRKTKKRREAYWEENKTYYFQPRYGAAPLVINKEKPLIDAGKSLQDVVKTIDKLIVATQGGALDDALAAAATRPSKGTNS